MTSRKLASAAAAASLAGAAVLGMGSPAIAQTGSELPQQAGASDSTPTPGQTVTITTGAGSFTPGSTVSFSLQGSSIAGTAVANSLGSASFTFTVPANAAPGRYTVVASGTLAGTAKTAEFQITVVAGAAASPGRGQGATGQSALPRTGSDQMVPLAITGIALVGAGAGIVVASRRRREDMPAGIA
jgi:LPXTG-motif cell wall-anchored protein